MAKRAPGEPIVIKKYANRRLYNTESSSYITLDAIATMVRDNKEFEVVDAKTGEDITHQILTQIIMERENSGGKQMLPVSFLRDLIGMYGNSMQALMPTYLETSMANFRKNREELASAFQQGMAGNPLARIAETNMAMMRAATEAFIPGAGRKPEASSEGRPEARPEARKDDEIAALREQMAAMQKKLDTLGD
ncbi:polyhydroxyalkanoate synthesis repressor PhaR [Qipengyuania sp. MTN3-11]|uniref:polyhydroxyalkanoate synthesis repressor PhaR n=1 Tax=Qipengyuania sp. MTN3-11 TaxID=3056557 RepID=UPI0036F2C12F